jgi:hypothetical protein
LRENHQTDADGTDYDKRDEIVSTAEALWFAVPPGIGDKNGNYWRCDNEREQFQNPDNWHIRGHPAK